MPEKGLLRLERTVPEYTEAKGCLIGLTMSLKGHYFEIHGMAEAIIRSWFWAHTNYLNMNGLVLQGSYEIKRCGTLTETLVLFFVPKRQEIDRSV